MTGSRPQVPVSYCAACDAMVHRPFRPGPDGRPGATCPRCGSLERHRFLSLLLGTLAPRLRDLDLVVEIAPSKQSTRLLERLGARRRISLDAGYDAREVDALASIDRLPLRDGSVDLLVCYHVLEHVPDDGAAMREVARVLSPRGIALLEVPIKVGVATEEDLGCSPEECERRFGQRDHVRWYGDDFDDRLSAAGLSSVRVTPPALLGEAAVRWFRLMPHEVVWIAGPGRGTAAPMVAGASASGLTAALDALLAELAHVQDRFERARARGDRLAATRDALRARLEEVTPRRRHRVITRLQRLTRL
ncbi:methyltransferase domain-containing protein [Nocardioides sp. S-58]|uniref:Methyltransferase domain-containing protein n=1 Tax=Nocardioides renjunii TaxID=3095075 RepID=A0ABU5KHG6_9ACTN|nr:MULTISPECIES: methyltransferase domain-containing protein [unclassified Nocardioides]MDZ5663925.1 methyltransferase domain-containing protein [Nocardioides sp. S-58]WQQ21015.1 methyltransferase domain-containing protein [Nocardioides sp. S-34]